MGELGTLKSWGNSGANYLMGTDCDTTGGGNLSVDPQFCGTSTDNFFLSNTSPCFGANNPCGLIGAFGLGCVQVPVRATTWSQIKNLFR